MNHGSGGFIISFILFVIIVLRCLNFHNDSSIANASRITGVVCLTVGALSIILDSYQILDKDGLVVSGFLLFIIGLCMTIYYIVKDVRHRRKQ